MSQLEPRLQHIEAMLQKLLMSVQSLEAAQHHTDGNYQRMNSYLNNVGLQVSCLYQEYDNIKRPTRDEVKPIQAGVAKKLKELYREFTEADFNAEQYVNEFYSQLFPGENHAQRHRRFVGCVKSVESVKTVTEYDHDTAWNAITAFTEGHSKENWTQILKLIQFITTNNANKEHKV